ncbi:MAG: DNRLRE domain-containing protein, partial [Halobacteriota archaeon]
MKKGVKVWSLIVILMFVTSVFGGVVSAENVSEDLTKSVADGEIQTVVDNISSAELAKYNIVLDEDQLRSDLSSSQSCTLYAIADGYAWSGGTENPSGASSTADELRVGFRTTAGNYRTLIKFDLSSIPAGATITSADLKLYYHLYSGTAGDPLDISVYRTTVDWNEGYLSWSKAENYNSFSYDTVTIIAGSGANYKAWDITALVQNWIDGTYSNYGVLLRAPTQSGSSIYRQFRSKEYGSNVPKLEVTFTTEQELLPAPTLISPYNGETGVSTTPYFDWSSVSGATHYWLMVAENENDLPDDPSAETCPNCVISEASLTSTSYTTSTALAEGTTYYWQVQAYEWGGSSVTRQGQFSQH